MTGARSTGSHARLEGGVALLYAPAAGISAHIYRALATHARCDKSSRQNHFEARHSHGLARSLSGKKVSAPEKLPGGRAMAMSLSLIHFGEIVFGGVDGVIDFLRRHWLLARTACCQRYIKPHTYAVIDAR